MVSIEVTHFCNKNRTYDFHCLIAKKLIADNSKINMNQLCSCFSYCNILQPCLYLTFYTALFSYFSGMYTDLIKSAGLKTNTK